ncbi:unnamed protein product [Lasius platythorax]|uniref:Uncharacterized protein n=1 Tax=Lasius platythorax TaxID=488582 RepID=A0AAV2P947_9HYME
MNALRINSGCFRAVHVFQHQPAWHVALKYTCTTCTLEMYINASSWDFAHRLFEERHFEGNLSSCTRLEVCGPHVTYIVSIFGLKRIVYTSHDGNVKYADAETHPKVS